MDERQYIINRLSEFQLRYSGKMPFGPLDDLEDLAKECKLQDTDHIFTEILDEYVHDPFWEYFINFYRGNKGS